MTANHTNAGAGDSGDGQVIQAGTIEPADTSPVTSTNQPRSSGLIQLADRINAEHRAAFDSARGALAHAAECGRLLIEARKKVPHGA